MKIGKGPSGIIGLTTNEKALKVWAKGHHLCGAVLSELENIRDTQEQNKGKHKEEYQGRISSDMKDREQIRKSLENCIHPLKIDTHEHDKMVNIFTGEETDDTVNVHDAQQIGVSEVKKFNEKLPEEYRDRLSTTVKTMVPQKGKKKEDIMGDFNTDLIFLRVLFLLGNDQLDLASVFKYELSPVPLSLFSESGHARYPTSKSILMTNLKCEFPSSD